MKKIIFPLASFFALIFVVTFTSCKKDPIETAKNDLQDFQWRITGQTVNGTDNFSKIPACEQDDIKTFKENGTVTKNQSNVKCAGVTETETNIGTWALSGEGKTLTWTDSKQNKITYTILELSDTTLKLEESVGTSTKVTIVDTYTKVK